MNEIAKARLTERGGVDRTRTEPARLSPASKGLAGHTRRQDKQVSNPAPAPHPGYDSKLEAKRAYALTFLLKGQLPSGKNAVRITRTGRRYPAQRFVEWRTETLLQMPTRLRPFLVPMRLHVTYTPGDARRRDVPGMLDAILHVLEKGRLVEDDAQIVDVLWHTERINREKPQTLISLAVLDRATRAHD